MQDIKKEYLKIYGYTPTDNEILNLYFEGMYIINTSAVLTEKTSI